MANKRLINLLIGAGIGSAITWLFTSKKGKEIRQKVKEETENLIRQHKNKTT